jgi:ATP-dependent RNA circularization protein (DNA/RNA ligase family)
MPKIKKFLGGVCGNKNLTLYAEVVGYSPTGSPLQIGYNYGLQNKECDLFFYDISVGTEFLDWSYVVAVCKEFNLPIVKPVYVGPFTKNILELADAVDEYNGQKYTREGIVIKPLIMKKHSHIGWVILKKVSESFKLNKTNSDFH